MTRHPAGAALLEVVIALAMLAIAGLALLDTMSGNLRAIDHARRSEREIVRANRFMDAVALWPREDLDRRLGWREQGPWQLRIDRPTETLYEVRLADSTRRSEILSTKLYRPVHAATR